MFKAAVGLAARLFPHETGDGAAAAARADILYLLDGHITAWAGWDHLDDSDRLRIARLLKRRTNDYANAHRAGESLDRMLAAGEISGCKRGDDGIVLLDPGMPLAAFVDDALGELDKLFAARPRSLRPAPPGHYTSTVRVPLSASRDRYTNFRFDLLPHHRDKGRPMPVVVDAPAADRITVPFAELKKLAKELDGSPNVAGSHRTEVVERFERSVRSGPGSEAVSCLELTAGSINELLAYTGFGKSVVLIEVFACWAIGAGCVVAFVLPTSSDVVKAAHQIETAATALQKEGEVVALTSPRSRIDVAETVTAHPDGRGPDRDWVWDRFGYGCALAAVATSSEAVDSWVPGREPCASLHDPRPDAITKTYACPWRASCGRFSASRAACTADVIVTSHANLLLGVLQTPVDDGYGGNDRLSVEELLLRRCQIVVIDEVDEFQQQAIEHSGRGLVLDEARQTATPLRRLDTDFAGVHGALHDEVDANVRDAFFGLRYLSENYVSHLTYQRLGAARPRKGKRKYGPGRAWIVPRRHDSWLMEKLFATDAANITEEQQTAFTTLFPGEPEPSSDAPAKFKAARRQLDRLIGSGTAGAAIADARNAALALVTQLSADDQREFADWVIRRTMLERLRLFLHRLMSNNSQLVDAGVESAQAVADALGTYGRWRATPTGPLGRLVFAFTEHFDDTGVQPAKLSTAAFGGDPHTYVVTLGDLTALAHAGTRRIVLGLSATSYFPRAPRHHLHTRPKWWVRDDSSARVSVHAAIVPGPAQTPVRISGVEGPARSAAVRQISAGLWTSYLSAEFDRLDREDPDRRRVLLATTSYAAAREVAEGLAEAGVNPPRICLAIPPRSELADGRLWQELHADRLEKFPSLPDADILIAPLARVERGVNIIGAGSRSALGSVWLIVRPVPVIDEPAELVAHIQAAALADHPGPSTTPVKLMEDRRSTAGMFLDKIVHCLPYFQAQPERVKLAVTAEMIVGAIQLVGRARRGGTPAVLHLVDGAFHDNRGSGFASLVTRLERAWTPDQRRWMTEFYGDTLQAFLDYAAKNVR
ncbi:hypothetical protein [Amycolatopsis nivea]|uniref:hypothetical protein n=1 Tax=Amycolatopsis nivea TaxID=1644109 RepID=UPI00106F7298|nr:hypothetical protein [Amycolatopsis nivea]